MATKDTKTRLTESFDVLGSDFGIKNKMAAPKLYKVVVATGVGSITDSNKLDKIPDSLAKITGQKPAPRAAKKSVAAFRSREGDVIGHQVTLRGAQMNSFMDKLIHIALPRTKDFRGINPKAIDANGNLTIGIREHTIFPETSDEDIRNIFGLGITLVTNVNSKTDAKKFFTYLGVPFAAEVEKAKKSR